MQTAIISVIVPVYNSERYLSNCLDSILAQVYKNFEIVLVNDGSTDKSGDICEFYSEKDRRIKYLKKNNGGVSSARNLGIKKAEGKYLTFIDADDWVEENFLGELYNTIKNNAQISICEIFHEKKDSVTLSNNAAIEEGLLSYLKYQIVKGFTSVCNMMFERKFIETCKLEFEPIRFSEDFIFSIKALCMAECIKYINKPLYHYNRVNETSAMHSYNREMYKDLLYCDLNVISFLKKQGLFTELKQEIYWRVLRNKKELILSIDKHNEFRSLISESNKYICSCPLINIKLKIMMWLLVHHFGFIVNVFVYVRNLFGKK